MSGGSGTAEPSTTCTCTSPAGGSTPVLFHKGPQPRSSAPPPSSPVAAWATARGQPLARAAEGVPRPPGLEALASRRTALAQGSPCHARPLGPAQGRGGGRTHVQTVAFQARKADDGGGKGRRILVRVLPRPHMPTCDARCRMCRPCLRAIRPLPPQPEGLPPAPRGAHACVALGSRVLVFGGADRAPVSFNDLWVLETGEWPQIQALLPRPSPSRTSAVRMSACPAAATVCLACVRRAVLSRRPLPPSGIRRHCRWRSLRVDARNAAGHARVRCPGPAATWRVLARW